MYMHSEDVTDRESATREDVVDSLSDVGGVRVVVVRVGVFAVAALQAPEKTLQSRNTDLQRRRQQCSYISFSQLRYP